MKIQSGWAKGLELQAPKGLETRPTSAKVRSAVFDMLRHQYDYESVLDLCSGSGSFGLEALSNGAKEAVFVEKSRQAAKSLRSNIEQLKKRANGSPIQATMLTMSVGDYAKSSLHKKAESIDLLWADPPYAEVMGMVTDILTIAGNQLTKDGVICIESARKDEKEIASRIEKESNFFLKKQKKYGDTLISIIEKTEGEA